tara:strand:- start:1437 stop:2894 length:1458 start_codon:yes stop_codon:yes gene_type:complete
MKKIYLQLAPAFLEFPKLIIDKLRNEGHQLDINGVITGKKSVVKKGQQFFPKAISFNTLEESFLEAEYNNNKVEFYREIFGDEVLNKIIIADRHVGFSYVNGGIQPRSIIAKKIKQNNLLPIIYVVELLEYLILEFTKNRPDLVFSYAVASSLSVALAEVSKYMGIKFLTLTSTRIKDKIIFDDSYQGLLNPISKLYSTKKLKISDEANAYFKSFTNKPLKPSYENFNILNLRKNYNWTSLLKNLVKYLVGIVKNEKYLRSNYKDSAIFNIKVILHFKFRKVNYDQVVYKEKYVYFPLHVDPEASTMVLSPFHTDQLSIIESISKSIPFDSYLYVKEHIHMIGKRPKGFYDSLKSYPKVKFISPFEDNFSLIKNAYVITTITGTTGWEGMMLKKPVIYIGNSPFLIINKGYILCQDLSKISSAFNQIKALELCSDEELLKYLTLIFENAFSIPDKLLWGELKFNTLQKYKEEIEIFSNEFLKELD